MTPKNLLSATSRQYLVLCWSVEGLQFVLTKYLVWWGLCKSKVPTALRKPSQRHEKSLFSVRLLVLSSSNKRNLCDWGFERFWRIIWKSKRWSYWKTGNLSGSISELRWIITLNDLKHGEYVRFVFSRILRRHLNEEVPKFHLNLYIAEIPELFEASLRQFRT